MVTKLNCGQALWSVAYAKISYGGGGARRSGALRIWQRGVQPGVWEFLRFSHKKTLILARFFIEKGNALSAVTIENAKIFSQLMSKNRSLAKISERRLQSLLVCKIID